MIIYILTSLSGTQRPQPPNLLHISYLGSGLSSVLEWALLHCGPAVHCPFFMLVHIDVCLVSYLSLWGQNCLEQGCGWFGSCEIGRIIMANNIDDSEQISLFEILFLIFWHIDSSKVIHFQFWKCHYNGTHALHLPLNSVITDHCVCWYLPQCTCNDRTWWF